MIKDWGFLHAEVVWHGHVEIVSQQGDHINFFPCYEMPLNFFQYLMTSFDLIHGKSTDWQFFKVQAHLTHLFLHLIEIIDFLDDLQKIAF